EDVPAGPGQRLVTVVGCLDSREYIRHVRGSDRINVGHRRAGLRNRCAIPKRVPCAADRDGQVPGQLRLRGKLTAGEGGVGDDLAPLLRIEEEGLILPKRTAEGESKIVPPQGRTRDLIEVVEIVVGLQDIVAEKLVGAAMKSIRPRPGDEVDLAAGASPVFGQVA